jgi:deoxyribodipyrimidine photo-lyase
MKHSIFWFRRDLRLNDNHGLYKALKGGLPVQCIFIFDSEILGELENPQDARVSFIHKNLELIHKTLLSFGSGLQVYHGKPAELWQTIAANPNVAAVYTNKDYEPYALERDRIVLNHLKSRNISFYTYKDHVIFEPNEVLKDNGTPYTVFSPFGKRWIALLNNAAPIPFPSEKGLHNTVQYHAPNLPSLASIGFAESPIEVQGPELNTETLKGYAQNRDFPGILSTSRLSVHLRFGTVSVRHLVAQGQLYSEKWLMELVWREFYQHIIFHFPHVVHKSFKPEFEQINWRNNEQEFEAWKAGNTGYPIVDAGMRELSATGFMHNRVRMIVASFLCKHLLIDWRWGEAWFAEKLLDFELASNNGGWQWSAGCGCDAAPYFRVFNPYLQTLKFDPNLVYIKKWVPELNSITYPQPIVIHEYARIRVLEAYKNALNGKA